MIGLAEAGRAVLGVLVLPAMARSLVGAEGIGAFEVAADGARTKIHVPDQPQLRGARVVVSRSHLSPEAKARIAELGLIVVPCGSSGVKAVKVASGEADLYAQPGRAGRLWDGCAPEAIVRAAGGEWSDARGNPCDYARETMENLHGVVAGNAALAREIIQSLARRS